MSCSMCGGNIATCECKNASMLAIAEALREEQLRRKRHPWIYRLMDIIDSHRSVR